MPIAPNELLSIGEVASRSGATVSAIRFYDDQGLIRSERDSANRRRYPRHILRRLAVIAAGQVVGLTLAEIRAALASLPEDRAPTQRDWQRVSVEWATVVDQRMDRLQRLRDSLGGCIGCGCLSLGRCTLFNAQDEAATEGAGSRWLRTALSPSAP